MNKLKRNDSSNWNIKINYMYMTRSLSQLKHISNNPIPSLFQLYWPHQVMKSKSVIYILINDLLQTNWLTNFLPFPRSKPQRVNKIAKLRWLQTRRPRKNSTFRLASTATRGYSHFIITHAITTLKSRILEAIFIQFAMTKTSLKIYAQIFQFQGFNSHYTGTTVQDYQNLSQQSQVSIILSQFTSSGTKQFSTGDKHYRRKSVAGVGNEQASFTDGSIADGNALYEPGGAHLVAGELPGSDSQLQCST